MDAEEKLLQPDNMKDRDAVTIGHPTHGAQFGSFSPSGDQPIYPPNIYSPQPQAFYYRGYDNGSGEWDEYASYINAEGLDVGSGGMYNENPSLVFHGGYGYGPQIPYGPYSPVTPPLPSVGGEAQFYPPQQVQYSGPPYYQQLGPPNMPYIPPHTPGSQPEFNALPTIDQQGENMLSRPRPTYPLPSGSFGRGNAPGNLGGLGFHEVFDGSRSGGIWSDYARPSDRHRPLAPYSPAVSPQPTTPFGSFGQNMGMAPQQQRSMYGFGSGSSSFGRGYMQGGFNQGPSFGNASVKGMGANNRGWLSFDNNRWRGNGGVPLCGCNGNLDILNEQNRGPRASKPKSQNTTDLAGASVESAKCSKSPQQIKDDSYNQPDFVTEYKEAKFFIIKSYSEDNVHKSIKYGIWASTPNGNKKLDAAYADAKTKEDPCPVFLLFSVNASAQFCGVAEMTGAVNFEKSVDYWQQDKWSGQFPVKWHMIKDVPNSQFRHIVLENNDNKPVTNSRDTQEVKLEQGIEMLNIFKKYETDMSILDDFEFYEDREKAMQERKARQQQQQQQHQVAPEKESSNGNAANLPGSFLKQMSKSFAQVVRLDDNASKEGGATAVPPVLDVEEATTMAAPPTTIGG
ncbi:YTH domain-containing protein ECT2 [Linum grandiflorum]